MCLNGTPEILFLCLNGTPIILELVNTEGLYPHLFMELVLSVQLRETLAGHRMDKSFFDVFS